MRNMHSLGKLLRKAIFCAVLFCAGLSGHTQDIHFSQFYGFPLYMNAASTGRINEDYRAGFLYRNQWKGANAAFETTAFGFDMNLKEGFLNSDKIGIGLFVINDDKAGIINSKIVNLTAAYHRFLDGHKRHLISGGAQIGMTQNSIGAGFTFGDEFDQFFNPTGTTGESFTGDNFNTVNINAGALYSYRMTERFDFYSGIAVLDANSPKQSLIPENDSSEIEDLRNAIIWHGGLNYKISDKLTLSPRILYMNRAAGRIINLGAFVGYSLPSNIILYGGLWYRWKDSAILMAGFKYKNMLVRASYDATVSSLTDISVDTEDAGDGKLGAFEITFTLLGLLNRPIPKDYAIPCGVF